jgi:hypothetical protein
VQIELVTANSDKNVVEKLRNIFCVVSRLVHIGNVGARIKKPKKPPNSCGFLFGKVSAVLDGFLSVCLELRPEALLLVKSSLNPLLQTILSHADV